MAPPLLLHVAIWFASKSGVYDEFQIQAEVFQTEDTVANRLASLQVACPVGLGVADNQ